VDENFENLWSSECELCIHIYYQAHRTDKSKGKSKEKRITWRGKVCAMVVRQGRAFSLGR
jgi:hypothetical protein